MVELTLGQGTTGVSVEGEAITISALGTHCKVGETIPPGIAQYAKPMLILQIQNKEGLAVLQKALDCIHHNLTVMELSIGA